MFCTGMHNTSLYTTYTLFNLHMCQVCGSFQCPYCRYYNSANSMRGSALLSYVTALCVYVCVRLFQHVSRQDWSLDLT